MGGGSQYRIPDELQEILLDFTVNYLIEQPSDIARWVTDLVSDIGYPKPGYMKPGFWFLEELCVEINGCLRQDEKRLFFIF